MRGSEYFRNAPKSPSTPVKRKRGHYVHFINGGAEKGIRALPRFGAHGGRDTDLLQPREGIPGPMGGRVGGDLVTGCGPKHPTFPRTHMGIQDSKKGPQKDVSPFRCEAKWKID